MPARQWEPATLASAAHLIVYALKHVVVGSDALDIGRVEQHISRQVRNSGRSGIAACAISAIDLALWDLEARLLTTPLCRLLGRIRDRGRRIVHRCQRRF